MNLTIALNETGLKLAATANGRPQRSVATTWMPTVLPPSPMDAGGLNCNRLAISSAHAHVEPPTLTARLLAKSSATVWEGVCHALLLLGAAVPLAQCFGTMERLVNAWPRVVEYFARLLA